MSWAALTEQLRDLAAGFSAPCADSHAAALLDQAYDLDVSEESCLIHSETPLTQAEAEALTR